MGKKWFRTKEQDQFLAERLLTFPDARSRGRQAVFFADLCEEWFKRWPERNALFKGTDGPPKELTSEQEEAHREAVFLRKERLKNYMYWHSNQDRNARRKKRWTTLADLLKREKRKRQRHLIEVYSRLYYQTKIGPRVMEEIEATAPPHQESKSEYHKRKMTIARRIRKECWSVETPDVVKIVQEERARLEVEESENTGKKKGKGGGEAANDDAEWEDIDKDVDSEEVDALKLLQNEIANLGPILNEITKELRERTGWCFTVLCGGLRADGVLQSANLHCGHAPGGNTFQESTPGFDQNVLEPWGTFLEQVFPIYKQREQAADYKKVFGIANPSSEKAGDPVTTALWKFDDDQDEEVDLMGAAGSSANGKGFRVIATPSEMSGSSGGQNAQSKTTPTTATVTADPNVTVNPPSTAGSNTSVNSTAAPGAATPPAAPGVPTPPAAPAVPTPVAAPAVPTPATAPVPNAPTSPGVPPTNAIQPNVATTQQIPFATPAGNSGLYATTPGFTSNFWEPSLDGSFTSFTDELNSGLNGLDTLAHAAEHASLLQQNNMQTIDGFNFGMDGNLWAYLNPPSQSASFNATASGSFAAPQAVPNAGSSPPQPTVETSIHDASIPTPTLAAPSGTPDSSESSIGTAASTAAPPAHANPAASQVPSPPSPTHVDGASTTSAEPTTQNATKAKATTGRTTSTRGGRKKGGSGSRRQQRRARDGNEDNIQSSNPPTQSAQQPTNPPPPQPTQQVTDPSASSQPPQPNPETPAERSPTLQDSNGRPVRERKRKIYRDAVFEAEGELLENKRRQAAQAAQKKRKKAKKS